MAMNSFMKLIVSYPHADMCVFIHTGLKKHSESIGKEHIMMKLPLKE